jgi:hypothetical protein
MAAAMGLVGSAGATLLDRGPALVYDDVLNITWTRNASLPGSSALFWGEANAWAANLVLSGYDDWRLPYSNVSAGSGPTIEGVFCDLVSELACRDNEMGYMFYYNLGGVLGDVKLGTQLALGGEVLMGIQPIHWAGTASSNFEAWYFVFGVGPPGGGSGGYEGIADGAELSAWAVRDGDVAAVHEPSTLLLLGAAMLGLMWTRYSSRSSIQAQQRYAHLPIHMRAWEPG